MTAPHMPIMNDEGLLECPFCGDTHAYIDSDGPGAFYVACSQCGCGTDQWPTHGKAVKSWNTRNGHLYTTEDFNQASEERDYGLQIANHARDYQSSRSNARIH